MIPVPRPMVLAGALLVGAGTGMLAGVGVMLLVSARLRPDVVIALVLGLPTVTGLSLILFSARRWGTTVGAFLLALAPGWFGALAAVGAAAGG